MTTIVGYVEHIVFQNSETGFTVALLQQSEKKDPTYIVGSMPAIQPGETLRCLGTWKQHLIHGQQFNVSECHPEAPVEVAAIAKYLGSGLIKGIGITFATRIVDLFGKGTLEVIDNQPERLLEVDGVGKKRLELIKNCWQEQKSIREVMIFLQSHQISPTYAQKIYKIYGPQSIQKVRENPYYLARDIPGIGFKSADKIAETLGIAKDSSYRIDAGIEFILHRLSEEGHVCFPLTELLKTCIEILGVDQDKINDRTQALKKEQRIEMVELFHSGVAEMYVWMRTLFQAEVGIAREILRLQRNGCALRNIDLPKALTWVQSVLKIELAENQRIAVTHGLTDKIHIITGGPGTGKSTITNAILAVTEKLTDRIMLAAPTGRAAKRMSEITHKKASTIHSLLEFNFKTGKFKHNRETPLECDLIIVDESSMIDTYLMYSLLKAIPNHARVVFVGDIHQLPSVGPGNVLKDLIASKTIPVTILNKIFRQAEGSRIITNAHKINQGILPELSFKNESDFYFIHADTPEAILHEITTLISHRLPKKYGFNAFEDIQVMAPMRKGIIGTINLNMVLQQTLNPKSEKAHHYNGMKFLVGDKVMQIRNNYLRNVYNGDTGRIVEIDTVNHKIVVKFDGKDVIYEFSDLDELTLSYAVSIHKSQGSEYPCTIIPMHTTHFKLLTRNLLYTGVTRGKKLVVLVGTTKAVGIAVRNDEVKLRHTGLQQSLIELTKGPLP